MGKTGTFKVEADVDCRSAQDPKLEAQLVRLLHLELTQVHIVKSLMDGRSYVVQSRLTRTPYPEDDVQHRSHKLTCSAFVALHDPKKAEVGEYVVLGSVETLIPNMVTFIHLGKDMMFQRDDTGWVRVELDVAESRSLYKEFMDLIES